MLVKKRSAGNLHSFKEAAENTKISVHCLVGAFLTTSPLEEGAKLVQLFHPKGILAVAHQVDKGKELAQHLGRLAARIDAALVLVHPFVDVLVEQPVCTAILI